MTEHLFQEPGFAATTIRDIASASKVSVGRVMAVGDKSALLVQVFDALIEEGHAQRVALGSNGASTCVERIMELVQPFVILFTSRADLARVYASNLVSGEHSSTLFTRLAALLVDEIRAVITRHGCSPLQNAEATASAVYFTYVGTLFTWSARESVDETELSDCLRASFAAICTCKEQSP